MILLQSLPKSMSPRQSVKLSVVSLFPVLFIINNYTKYCLPTFSSNDESAVLDGFDVLEEDGSPGAAVDLPETSPKKELHDLVRVLSDMLDSFNFIATLTASASLWVCVFRAVAHSYFSHPLFICCTTHYIKS